MDDLEYLLKTTRIIRECSEILKESNDAAAQEAIPEQQPDKSLGVGPVLSAPLPAEAVSEFLEDK